MKKIVLLLAFISFGFATLRAESAKTLSLTSEKLKISWQKEADGWHVTGVSVNDKTFSNPKGYYTLLYLNRKPAAGLVYQDIEGKAFTFYPSDADVQKDGSIKFTQTLRFGKLQAIWKIDPKYPNDVMVSMNLKMTTRGSISIGCPTILTFDKEDISWGMVPGYWYGSDIQKDMNLAKTYSMGIPCAPALAAERSAMTLCPLITSKNKMTLAVIPEPGTENNPYPKDSIKRADNKVALSIMNRHDEYTPMAYAPVLGQAGSLLDSGKEANFNFRYTIQDSDWFPVFSHAVDDIYNLPGLLDIQHNKMSLSERVSRLQKYLRDDKKSSWKIWDSRGYKIGANGAKIADAGTMYMIAYNGYDESMKNRLPYVRNHKLAQQEVEPGFFQGAALGEYADEDGVESERGNWIEPLHTTYYTMVDYGNMLLFNPNDADLSKRLRMAAEKLLLWQHEDGSFDVGYDRFSHKLAFADLQDFRPTWYGLLIAYRILKDEKYLKAAEKGAMWQWENG
ncbi:MAG: hypothetical protein PHS30_05735, partial [Bacteroidales bacterium]|nr:hypothetical protein [Bacteroidales bacterium]